MHDRASFRHQAGSVSVEIAGQISAEIDKVSVVSLALPRQHRAHSLVAEIRVHRHVRRGVQMASFALDSA
jgi:hypothetical protein